LAAAQWAKADLLVDETTNLNNFTYVGSMQNLGMSFIYTPEAAYNDGCNPQLDMNTALGLLNQTDVANNNRTLLNPVNVRDFEKLMADGAKGLDEIIIRFGLFSGE